MKLVVSFFVLVCALNSTIVEGSNNFGSGCAACHSSAAQEGGLRPGSLEVLGAGLLTLHPTKRNDGVSRGAIPYFAARAGDTVEIDMQVVDGRTSYAVSIDNFEADSVTGPANTHFLTGYAPDSSWYNYASSPPNFFVNVDDPPAAIAWSAGQVNPVPYTFELELAANTPVAIYELEISLAGVLADISPFTPRLFVDTQFVYLEVFADPHGDFDNDGQVAGPDYLLWQQEFPATYDAEDLVDWEAYYGGAPPPQIAYAPVPEPTAGLLLALAYSFLSGHRWR